MKCANCGHVISDNRKGEQSRLLHKAIRSYALATGYDIQWAKVELKYKYGVWESVPLDVSSWTPPQWAGAFLEMYPGTPSHQIVFMKSEPEYTIDEEAHLIDSCVARCYDAGADMRWFEEYEEAKSAVSKTNQKAKDQDNLQENQGGSVESV